MVLGQFTFKRAHWLPAACKEHKEEGNAHTVVDRNRKVGCFKKAFRQLFSQRRSRSPLDSKVCFYSMPVWKVTDMLLESW